MASNGRTLAAADLSDYEKKAQSGEMHERPKSNDWPRDQAPLPAKQSGHDGKEQKLLKVCAKFQGGVRWGLGMRFERTCRPETCQKGCEGTLFRRKCRIFDFRPHYEVRTISGKDAVFKLNVSSSMHASSDLEMQLTHRLTASRLLLGFPFRLYTLLSIGGRKST